MLATTSVYTFVCNLATSLLLLGILGGILVVTFQILLPEKGQWADMESHHCDEFCENSNQCDHEIEERPTLQQPINAYSNLAYLWCGVIPLVFLRIDLSTAMYFVSSALLGVSSFMYHASITLLWRNLDSANMYTYISVLCLHGIHGVLGVSWRWLTPLFLGLAVAMPFVRPRIPLSIESLEITAGQVLVIFVLSTILVMAKIYKILSYVMMERRNKRSRNILVVTAKVIMQVCIVIFVAIFPALVCLFAYLAWTNDREKKWCDPDSVFQWHGVWHVLTAISSLWVWLFFDCNSLREILASSSSRERVALVANGRLIAPEKLDLSSRTSSEGGLDSLAPFSESESDDLELAPSGR